MPRTVLVRRVPTRVISLKKGGKVEKTGLHQLHKGEVVLPANVVKSMSKTFSKGSMSKTMKGEKDFTTKKTSKDFDRGGKRMKTAEGSKVKRTPYSKRK
tara:strand:- start:234 stop:530 length:297 start_codon:yes stop_codon:yes gene_type:complete